MESMVTINGIEYGTKEEAAARVKQFVADHPETQFCNYAHCKSAIRETTTAEREKSNYLTVTVYEWNKLYTASKILESHPELKGLWRERQLTK